MDEPLTIYRVGVGVATRKGDLLLSREDPEREARYIRTNLVRRLAVLKQMQVDAESSVLIGRISPVTRRKILAMATSVARVLSFVDAPKLAQLPVLLAAGGLNRKTLKIAILYLAPGLFRRYKLLRKNHSAASKREI